MSLSSDEPRRIAELLSFDVLDTDPEEAFDSITRLVATACDVPIALLSFVDADRQWFKSRVGLNVCETSRDASFCAHAIAEPSDVFVVADTLLDLRFKDNPLVTGEPKIRFYAGVPIVSEARFALGTICVIDTQPRFLSDRQIALLQAAAKAVLAVMSARRAASELRGAADLARDLKSFSSLPPRPIKASGTSLERLAVALDAQHEIPTAVIDALPGAFFVLDPGGRFLLWNRRLEEVSGYDSEELPHLLAVEMFDGRDVPRVSEQIMRAFVQGQARLDADVVTKDGTAIPYFFTASAVQFKGRTCIAGMGIDISDRKRAEDQLRHSALHDPLTGLANRVLLDQRLSHAINVTTRDGNCAAVILLDLDRFKNVNDTLGHRVGDQLLISVGRRIRSVLRTSDTVARPGGDEFVVVTELGAPADATLVVEALRDVFREPFSVSGMKLHVTPSVGISIAPQDGIDREDLLRNADTAMYIAKNRGPNKYCFFTRDMHVAAARRLSTENDLRGALERSEFELFYQPAMDLRTGHAVGAEALIRWHHPQRGLLPPREFIDIAEESGLIVPIGAWVLAEGAHQARRLSALDVPPCDISVNVSGRQLRDPAFPGHVRTAVEGIGLRPEALGIEITESAALGDPDAAQAVLIACKRLGLLVLLDDFGTHYSSLTYLKKFPIDIIKIDKSFVDGLPHDVDDAGIVTAIIGLARSLKCGILAEGVENEAQARWLFENGCRIATGYHYARPMPRDEFEKWLTDNAKRCDALEARA